MSGHGLLLFQTALLVAISLAVLYPVVAHSRSVLHTEAIVTLAVSTLVFTVGSLAEQGLGNTVAAEGIYLCSAVLFGASVWLFAREFVRSGEASFEVGDEPAPSSGSGFPDVPDDDSEGGFTEAPMSRESTERGFADATEGEDGE
jgi:hypothetical protein